MRIRSRRQPPQPFLLRLQLADALLERAAPGDLAQGQELLLDTAAAPEVLPADLHVLVQIVHDRVDALVPRAARISLLNWTIDQLERAEAPSLPVVDPAVREEFAAELQNQLLLTSLKRMIASGADVHLQHTVALSQQLAAVPADGPNSLLYRSHAAMMLVARADTSVNEADLDAAATLLGSMLESAEPLGDYDRALLKVNLGFVLIQRSRLLRDEPALAQGRELIESALREADARGVRDPDLVQSAASAFLAVPGHGGRERAVELLAELPPATDLGTGFTRFAATMDGSDPATVRAEAQALEALLDQSPQTPTLLTSFARRELGRQALRAGDWERALAAFASARDEFTDLYEVQALPASRERILGLRHDLAILHAYALTRAGDLEAAVDALEESRARLLSEALDLEADDLRHVDPVVAQRYREASRRLGDLVLDESGGLDRSAMVDEARTELRMSIAAVRAQPGAESFLVPSGRTEARQATARGRPLVYLAAAEIGGFALILEPHGPPRLVDLPSLSRPELVDRAVDLMSSYHSRSPTWPRELRSILAWLAAMAMEPLLNALDGTDEAVLIAMDLLGLMPLHAAVPSSRVAFTHAPSARFLLAARELESIEPGRLLVVADTRPDDAPLPDARREAAAVAVHFADVVEHTTRDAVLAALPDRDVLHFACHGAVDLESPRQSRLTLSDGPLTVAALMATPVRARLAVLSACETAMIGIDVLDEVVGLPAGLLQAGSAGVLGTLWRVDSRAAALLVARFYDAWRIEGQSPVQAVRTAQHWLRECTNEEAHRRYPDLRPEPDREPADVAFWRAARPFTAHEHWAALHYVGI
ncbi:CHAT domain-containing protein [Plantactinospora sp. KLBMP9567]|uniref:CHAT domain-containing protein n=1 Tax=Plantactinospora sp. KLBMP9567 TaxID=3085900 RepID=UPI0029820D7D|nr:CHAT domain-containing protein [Plantactinospora sp. KLBMP9567]MDW5329575.1 CHAT domain-containing protein [Plantactinospora sp. KLBMP9567]